MEILKTKIAITELQIMAKEIFGDFVKAVVDIDRRIIAVNADLHSDEETLLLENGSDQKNLWGINIYPDNKPTSSDFVEFDSMINIRANQKNFSRSVENEEIRKSIVSVVQEWLL